MFETQQRVTRSVGDERELDGGDEAGTTPCATEFVVCHGRPYTVHTYVCNVWSRILNLAPGSGTSWSSLSV